MPSVPAITIDNVFPWGRSFDEYCRMFSLTDKDLGRRILGCADGPAAFNAELTRQGGRVVSCDPLYQFSTEEIRVRIQATCQVLVDGARVNHDKFVWDTIRSPEHLGQIRMAAMEKFLADYEAGKAAGRYICQALPDLDFSEQQFDLAICSHLLFLYSDDFSEQHHLNSILEMCRLAREVRIFPVLDMRGNVSKHLAGILRFLPQSGLTPELVKVDYEFQRNGDHMLCVCPR